MIFLNVISGNYCYKIKNQEMFDDFESDISFVIGLLKLIFFKSVNIFKEQKYSISKIRF